MEVQLGKVQRIKAIDDGGVSFRFRRQFELNLQSQRVILSVEVKPFANHPNKTQAKRKKHVKENDEDTANRHAAQIFTEMLGQVCHKEYYELLENEYQEVPRLSVDGIDNSPL